MYHTCTRCIDSYTRPRHAHAAFGPKTGVSWCVWRVSLSFTEGKSACTIVQRVCSDGWRAPMVIGGHGRGRNADNYMYLFIRMRSLHVCSFVRLGPWIRVPPRVICASACNIINLQATRMCDGTTGWTRTTHGVQWKEYPQRSNLHQGDLCW